jgi:small-conductance mechanosensitive channel
LTKLKGAAGILVLVAVLLGVIVWANQSAPTVAVVTVISAAAILSFQSVLQGLIAGRWVRAEACFKPGDYLNVLDGPQGRVLHVGPRITLLRAPDERVTVVTNQTLFTFTYTVGEPTKELHRCQLPS